MNPVHILSRQPFYVSMFEVASFFQGFLLKFYMHFSTPSRGVLHEPLILLIWSLKVKKVKFSPLQALEALRVVRGWGSHIF
jgi:hypothetical protein